MMHCIMCRKAPIYWLYRLCSECFARQLERYKCYYPRQTGRTTGLVKVVLDSPIAIFIVHSTGYARVLELQYPLLQGRIKSLEQIQSKRDLEGVFPVFDHLIWETPQDLAELRRRGVIR